MFWQGVIAFTLHHVSRPFYFQQYLPYLFLLFSFSNSVNGKTLTASSATRRQDFVDEDVSSERSDNIDYYYDDDYEYQNDDYHYDHNASDGRSNLDYDEIHSKVPFHQSQISYKEAIYLPSLYKPVNKKDKVTLQRNRLRDVFLTIRRQCQGGRGEFQGGLCGYFFWWAVWILFYISWT